MQRLIAEIIEENTESLLVEIYPFERAQVMRRPANIFLV